MTDLPATVWSEIVKASVYLPDVPRGTVGRFIGIGTLQTIIRKRRRSNDQNALAWALYEDILRLGGESLGGWTKEDLHTYLLGEHFGWERYEAFGMTRQKPRRRSSRLSKTEFADYIEFVVRRMAEHGIILQLPGEQAA